LQIHSGTLYLFSTPTAVLFIIYGYQVFGGFQKVFDRAESSITSVRNYFVVIVYKLDEALIRGLILP
jgi:hypothetical protein